MWWLIMCGRVVGGLYNCHFDSLGGRALLIS